MPNKPHLPPPTNPKPIGGPGPIKGPDPSKRVNGTSTNPIYGGGSTIMSSINSLTTPVDRGNHQTRNPGAPISHVGHNYPGNN